MLQVAQAAMNNPRRPTGHTGGEIVLLNQQRPLAGTGALPRQRHAINAAANHHHVEMLPIHARSRFNR